MRSRARPTSGRSSSPRRAGRAPADGAGGTVGSPAAAEDAVAVGALAAPGAVARVDLEVGGADAAGAALLAGAPPADGLKTAGPVEATDPAELLDGDRAPLRGRIAVVRAGDRPVARAAAAAAAGASAVLLADPRARPLPAIPAGRIAVPVVGVTGAAAAAVLEQAAGAEVTVGDSAPGTPPATGLRGTGAESAAPAGLSPFSSRGPAAGGGVKPDLAAPGAALTAAPGGGGAIVGGTAIAAARAAVAAARLARERPSAAPRELRAALIAAADPDPRAPARGAGAGILAAPPAAAPVTARTVSAARADPCPGTAACVRVRLANQGAAPAVLALSLVVDAGTRATLARERITLPPGARREAEIDVTAAPAVASGRLVVRDAGGAPVLVHPFAAATAAPEPPPLGKPRLERTDGRVRGVRFTLGAFERGDPFGAGSAVALTERLALTLVEAGGGRVVRRLTPPGGARELLPAEYEYTLPAGALRALPEGRYAFRAVARGPRGGEPAEARSEAFAP